MKEIAAEIWQVTGPALSMPLGMKLPASATVVRLPDKRLVLYSPVEVDDASAAEIDAAGEVAYIVVPSLYHHMFAPAAAKRWPKAELHAVPGVERKQPELKIARELGPDSPWGDAIDVEVVGGVPKIHEAVLFHRASGTLVCADLFFHVTQPANLITRMVLGMMGTGGRRLAQSRMWSMMCKDREAARASVQKMLGWGVSRIAPCHGEAAELEPGGLAKLMKPLNGRPVDA